MTDNFHNDTETLEVQQKILERLFSLKKYPVRYLAIPKCGCTFVKNLFWQIDNQSAIANPLRIHDRDADFLRTSDLRLSLQDVRSEAHAFTIVRNPVDRFFSLYTDKVIGEGYKRFVPLRMILSEKYGLIVDPKDKAEHNRNCHILIEWIEQNLSSKVDIHPEAHWTPQMYRKNIFKSADLRMVLMKNMNQRLHRFLEPVVPQVGSILHKLERNRSTKRIKKLDVLDQKLRWKINKVYRRDRELFLALRNLDAQSPSKLSVPRYSEIQDVLDL